MISPSAGGVNIAVTKSRPENIQNCFRKRRRKKTPGQQETKSYSVGQVIDANEGARGARPCEEQHLILNSPA